MKTQDENEIRRIPTSATIKQAIEDFPNYLYTNGKTGSTKEAYMRDVRVFYEFMKNKFPSIRYVNALTPNEIKFYKDHLLNLAYGEQASLATIKRRFNGLKVFFNFLKESNFVVRNIIAHDTFGNKRNNTYHGDLNKLLLPNYLRQDEIDIIINVAQKKVCKNTYRDVAVLEMLRSVGCRRSTILSLEWKDVDFFKEEILLKHSKTGSANYVRLPKRLKEALLNYRDSLGVVPIGKVFISRQGESLSTSAFNDMFKKHVESSGFEDKKGFEITAKTFRHSFITFMVQNNMPLDKIMRYTGHKDKETLAIYTHLNANDLDDVANLIG